MNTQNYSTFPQTLSEQTQRPYFVAFEQQTAATMAILVHTKRKQISAAQHTMASCWKRINLLGLPLVK